MSPAPTTPFPVTADERDLILALRSLTTARDAANAAKTAAEAKKNEHAARQKDMADALAVIRRVVGES